MRIERWIACGNGLGEGPVWCPREQRLWWVDIVGPALYCADWPSGALREWVLPKPPGSIALREDGSLLILFRQGPAVWRDGTLEWLKVPGLELGETRFNDGKCDRLGRFWCGTMDRKTTAAIGSLYRMSALDQMTTVDGGLTIANGIGFSPDNRTLYHADTPSLSIHAYDFDLASGAVAGKRLFARMQPGEGGPDGLTVDAQGGVWSVQFDRGCLHRYAPDGQLERVVTLPVRRPTSVMFGGPDFKLLFVTTARMHLSDDVLQAQPWSGDVLVFDPGVRGLPEPRCSF